MTPVLVAIVIGVGLGLITGGRLRHLGKAHLKSLWLLLIGAALQATSARLGAGASVVFLISYAFLAAFALRNMARTGMGIMLLGVALNAAPIVLDGGMPVEAHAIVSAGISSPGDVAGIDFGGKRHLARKGDHLRALDDTIPEWFTHEVLSFGDLVIALGVAAVVTGLLHPGSKAVSQRS